MKTRFLLLLGSVLTLAACEPTLAVRGTPVDPDALAHVTVGETTREGVVTLLGTPTSISTVDEKTWYYISRQTQQYAFLAPETLLQQLVEVDFDEKGIVTAARSLDPSRASDIDPVARATPTYGREYTFIQELLGDLAHPMPSLKSQKQSQPGS